MKSFKHFFAELSLLLRSVSPLSFSAFLLAVFGMNLLANKSILLPFDWLALDCGIAVSWIVFLCMDVFTKYYGPKAATLLSVCALVLNLFACLLLSLASMIPGVWGAYYDFGELPVLNEALDSTFGGTYYVILGSSAAFLISAIFNNLTNWGIGKLFKKKKDGFFAYAASVYLSTAVGQFLDNLIFALFVSHLFFGWSLTQCFTCAATGMIAELLCEAVFSPLGFFVIKRWKREGVGKAYFEFLEAKQ